MTPLEQWIKYSPEAEYFRKLDEVLREMPIDFDGQARARMNAAFQRAAEVAMGVNPSEERN